MAHEKKTKKKSKFYDKNRSSVTGKFITPKDSIANPDESIRHRIRRPVKEIIPVDEAQDIVDNYVDDYKDDYATEK